MAVILSRDKASTISLLSTYGSVTLQCRDGEEVQVPLVPLLGASPLIRSIVAESHLHPSIHGPLNLSFAVDAEFLVNVGDILGEGESNVREENIEKVIQVLNSLGVEAKLSQSRINNEYVFVATNEEDKQEMELTPVSDKEIDLSEGDVSIEKLEVCSPGKSYHNKAVGKKCKCSICNFSCSYPSQLKAHIRSHTGEKPFKCKICSYSCTKSSHLKVHSRSHTGEKPFKCKICSYSCTQSSHLKSHSRIHTGQKPYACKICSYACSDPSGLKRHKLIHTGEKSFKCKVCSFSCTQSSNLKAHTRSHTGEKPFKCKICSYSCTKASNLKVHNRIHTG